MDDPLSYTQRLKLGAIGVRRDCADQARRQAIQAALLNDLRLCEMLHAEADQHEAAIIEAIKEMALDRPAIVSMPSQRVVHRVF
ncbi:MAG TPA: hypothetical protein VKQ27_14690 [Acetobacteraceae bacterium]|nr:hypothetical protein [Acetobacteraceae bacterium]